MGGAKEANTANNTVKTSSSGQTMKIKSAAAFTDLAGVFGRRRLTTSVVAGRQLRGSVEVVLVNKGNVPTARSQRVNVALVAVNTADGSKTVLSRRTRRMAWLRPGTPRRLQMAVNSPTGLKAGDYTLEARIVTLGGAKEANTANNTVALNLAGLRESLTCA